MTNNFTEDLMKLQSVLALSLALIVGALFWTKGALLGASGSGLSRTDSGGGVTVKVTYLHPQSAGDNRFEISLDTHSVNLDGYDLKALSLLRDDTGKTYQPSGVENKGTGHHREIVLNFPKTAPGTKRLEVVIKDIAGIKERSFFWDLQ